MIEIITGLERRRRWSVVEKLRIVAESQEPGARVCDVAARHEREPEPVARLAAPRASGPIEIRGCDGLRAGAVVIIHE